MGNWLKERKKQEKVTEKITENSNGKKKRKSNSSVVYESWQGRMKWFHLY